MIRNGRLIALFIVLAAFFSAARAQQLSLADLQSKIVGTWLATVEGEPRTRNLVIDVVAQKAEGVFVMTGTFTFSDANKPSAFKDGEILQSSGNVTLVFTTGADSVYTGSLKPDGTVTGTTKYKNGQVKPFKLEKGAVAATAAPVAAAAPIVEFDGKWAGDAFPSMSCVRGVYDVAIKDGRISGTVAFDSRLGKATSAVTGQVRPDKTAILTLAKQQDYGRSSRFQVTLEKDQIKGNDKSTNCTYEVVLKRG